MVIHQANIDVDELGTEAAAATAVGMDTTGAVVCRSRATRCHGSRDRPVRAQLIAGLADGYRGRASQAFQAASALPAVTSSP
jgi:hypothetical protein